MTTLGLLLALALASPDHDEPNVALRVATYNVWGLPWPLAPRRADRLAAVGTWAEERGIDVVALQEVWGRSGRHVAAGLPEGWTLTQPGERGDPGLAIATDRAVTSVGFAGFSARRGPDALKRKGVWWVQVGLDDGCTVTLGIVHLQAGTSPRHAGVRRAQIQELLDVLPEGPVVLLGDFNLHDIRPRDAESHELLREQGFVEARADSERSGTSRYGADRLDRLYLRGVDQLHLEVARGRVGRPSDLSDHRPVWVDFVARGAIDEPVP